MQVARMRDRWFRERGREGVAGAVNRSFRILIGWNSEGCTGGWGGSALLFCQAGGYSG